MFKFRKPTLCTVASTIVGLFCAVVSAGIGIAIGAHVIIVAILAAIGFVGYFRFAHFAFEGDTTVKQLFDFSR
jgi:O-antigen/teichoic acid export membrane protein